MSRRKQLKPRALKRDQDNEEIVAMTAEEGEEDGEEEVAQRISSKSLGVDGSSPDRGSPRCYDNDDSALTPMGRRFPECHVSADVHQESSSAAENTSGSGTATDHRPESHYRCDICSAVFASLRRFMDHRNYDCNSEVVKRLQISTSPTSGQSTHDDSSAHGSSETITSPTRSRDLTPRDLTTRDLVPRDSVMTSSSVGEQSYSAVLDVDVMKSTSGVECGGGEDGDDAEHSSPYDCDFSEKSYGKEKHLQQHDKLMHAAVSLRYSCKYCRRQFRHKKSRDRHIELHHVTSADMTSSGTCPRCHVTFERIDDVQSHLRKEECGVCHECIVCGQCFVDSALLEAHSTIHSEQRRSGSRGEDDDEVICERCHLCGLEVTSLRELSKHLELHVTVSRCGSSADDRDGDGDVDIETEGEGQHSTLRSFVDIQQSNRSIVNCATSMFKSRSNMDNEDRFKIYSTHKSKKKRDHDNNFVSTITDSGSSKKHELAGRDNPDKFSSDAYECGEASLSLDCPYCSRKDFARISTLTSHIHTHHSGVSDNLFSCNGCGLGFATSTKLSQHISRDCLQMKETRTAAGDKTIGPSSGDKKMMSSCEFCPMEFFDTDSLKMHTDNVHRNNGKSSAIPTMVFCSQCTMGFPHIYALADHMHHSHGYNNNSKLLNGNNNFSTATTLNAPGISSPSSAHRSPHNLFPQLAAGPERLNGQVLLSKLSPSSDSSFISNNHELNHCRLCDVILANRHAYQLHLDGHRKGLTAEQNGAPDTADLIRHRCEECSMTFLTEDQLEVHSFTHFLTMSTEYGCSSCHKLFAKPDELQKHLMDMHAHHLYRCALCKHVFDSKVNIQVHFAVKHSDECKVYRCASCSQVFRSEIEWQLHVKVHHVGVTKPYRCFFCKDSFNTEAELHGHVTTHKKQYSCPICHEAFLVEYLLDKHLETKHSETPVSEEVRSSAGGGCMDLMSYDSVVAAMTSSRISPANGFSSGEQKLMMSPISMYGTKLSPSTPLKTSGGIICKREIVDSKSSDDGRLQQNQERSTLEAEIQQLLRTTSAVAAAAAAAAAANSVGTAVASATIIPEKSSPGVSGSGGSGGGVVGVGGTMVAVTSDKFSQLCVYCKQTFKTKGELEKHMKTHVLPSNQKCNICDEVFPSSLILAEHKLTHCKVVKGNICVICKAALKTKDEFIVHSQHHTQQGSANMQCVVCRQTLASLLELQLHGRHHFQESYSCAGCSSTFDSKDGLVSKASGGYLCQPCYHRDVIMSRDGMTSPRSQPTSSSSYSLNPSPSVGVGGGTVAELRCLTCGQTFESRVLLALHSLEHRRTFQCIKCQESFASEYDIQIHVATHVLQEGNVHQCYICDGVAAFDSPAKLQAHLIEHSFNDDWLEGEGAERRRAGGSGTGAREMRCYVCDRVFLQASVIQAHMLEHGLGNRKYLCNTCPQRFFFAAELQNHRLSLNHDLPSGSSQNSSVTANDLKCPDCPKSFANHANLSSHRRVHEMTQDSALVECTLCPVRCNSIRAMQDHLIANHSSERSAFIERRSSALKQQQRSEVKHEPRLGSEGGGSPAAAKPLLQCPECNRQFPSLSSLQGHMRVHNSGTKYSCTVCGKAFSLPQNLAIHMTSHDQRTGSSAGGAAPNGAVAEDLRTAAQQQQQQQQPYKCKVCHKRFSKKDNLKSHMKSHVSDGPRRDNMTSSNFDRLQEYFKIPSYVTGGSSVLGVRSQIDSGSSNSKIVEQHLCPICGGRFTQTIDLAVHLHKIHSIKAEVVETEFPSNADYAASAANIYEEIRLASEIGMKYAIALTESAAAENYRMAEEQLAASPGYAKLFSTSKDERLSDDCNDTGVENNDQFANSTVEVENNKRMEERQDVNNKKTDSFLNARIGGKVGVKRRRDHSADKNRVGLSQEFKNMQNLNDGKNSACKEAVTGRIEPSSYEKESVAENKVKVSEDHDSNENNLSNNRRASEDDCLIEEPPRKKNQMRQRSRSESDNEHDFSRADYCEADMFAKDRAAKMYPSPQQSTSAVIQNGIDKMIKSPSVSPIAAI